MLALDGPYSVWIHGADYRPRRRRWTIPQRRLTHYLLVCSKDGEEQLRVNGEEFKIGPDESYLICPNVVADIGSKHGNRPVWCHFDVRGTGTRTRPPFADACDTTLAGREKFLQPSPLETWGVDLPVVVPLKLQAVFAATLEHIVKLWMYGDPCAAAEANHLLSGLMLKWAATQWRESKSQPQLSLESRIEKAEAQARQNLDSGFGVIAFAAAAGLSRSHFCAIYRRLRGLSPGDFLRRERIRQAEGLLLRSKLTVAAIGEMVGYRDPTVFGRVFRAAHRTTPERWRRKKLMRERPRH